MRIGDGLVPRDPDVWQEPLQEAALLPARTAPQVASDSFTPQ
jgi:hypothetical protein